MTLLKRSCAMSEASVQELAAVEGGDWSGWLQRLIEAFHDGFMAEYNRNH
jgi:hypothetical protein